MSRLVIKKKTKRVLELFSGTHSIGHACSKRGYEVVSVDWDLPAKSSQYDYTSKHHIKTDILKWDYKSAFKPGHFDLITMSPTCTWWSLLRLCNIGRTLQSGRWKGQVFTREMADQDIIDLGIPMVMKCLEILDYFKPKHFWIENPQTGRMKYVLDKLLPYVDLDYCKFGFNYRKSTRFWTNIKVKPIKCRYDCKASIPFTRRHIISVDSGTSKHERYRIPEELINYLLDAAK